MSNVNGKSDRLRDDLYPEESPEEIYLLPHNGNTLVTFSRMHMADIKYIRADKVQAMLDQYAAEQREACSEAVSKELVKRGWVIKSDKHLREACLNAVEKEWWMK